MKTIGIVIVAALLLLVGGVWWSNKMATNANGEAGIISRDGVHWHPQLEIYVKGEKIDISPNIGLGAVHRPIHTHDDLPLIHMEFDGVVRTDDTTLGAFFRNWGRTFSSTELFEHQNGPDGTVHMFVNGEENTEFENYHMRDGDRIEIRYE